MISSSCAFPQDPPIWTKTAFSWKSASRVSILRSDIQSHFSLERLIISCPKFAFCIFLSVYLACRSPILCEQASYVLMPYNAEQDVWLFQTDDIFWGRLQRKHHGYSVFDPSWYCSSLTSGCAMQIKRQARMSRWRRTLAR